MLFAGQLNKKITIQQPERTQSDSGDLSVIWTDVATHIWANVELGSSSEKIEAEQLLSVAVDKFRIKPRKGITETMRIIFNNDIYNIQSVKEVYDGNGRVQELFIEAERKGRYYLLDEVSNVVLALSVRRLRSNYIGDVLRVRVDGDGGEKDIPFIGNDLNKTTVTDFEALKSASNSYVTTWYSQDDTEKTVSNTAEANQPTLSLTGGSNGMPVIEFDGLTQFLHSNEIITTGTATIFMVYKQNDWQNEQALLDIENENYGLTVRQKGVYPTTNIKVNDTSDYETTLSTHPNLTVLLTAEYENGVVTASNIGESDNGGTAISGDSTNFAANMDVSEIIICNSTITESQKTQIQNDIKRNYNIS